MCDDGSRVTGEICEECQIHGGVRVIALSGVHREVGDVVIIEAPTPKVTEDEGDDGHGGSVDGERPQEGGRQPAREHRPPHLSVRRPATVQEAAILPVGVRLVARLDHVDRVGTEPRADTGHAA